MPVSILSYQGNPNLGLGANPQIPTLPTNPNLDFINQTIRDISARDHDTNLKIYGQKIADRNRLQQMILDGQVPPGDIDPKYRTEYDKARDEMESVFTKYGGDIVNNPQGFREYAKARNDLRDVVAHAQTNTIELEKMKQEAAKEPLPWKRKRIEDHYKKQYQKPFWDVIDPFQQVYDMDIDKIIGEPKRFSRLVPDPKNPLNEFQEEYVSYNDILKKQVKDFSEAGENWYNQQLWLDKLQSYDPAQRQLAIDAMNSQLENYNQERRLQPGMEDYVAPIKVVRAPNGQQFIQESVPELAAKTALAAQTQYATRTPKFRKEVAQYQIDREKLALQGKKLGIDAAKADAYIRNLNAKTQKFVRDEENAGTNVARQYEDFINVIRPSQLTITEYEPTKIGQKPKVKSKRQEDVIYTNDLPGSYQYINGPIMATDKSGKPTGKVTIGRLDPFVNKKSGKQYYIPRYVISNTGEEVNMNSDFIKDTYNSWRREGYTGTINDMMRELLRSPGALELTLKGQNGAANYTSMYQSAKALNAAGTSKGEENIVNPPPDIPQEPEE